MALSGQLCPFLCPYHRQSQTYLQPEGNVPISLICCQCHGQKRELTSSTPHQVSANEEMNQEISSKGLPSS